MISGRSETQGASDLLQALRPKALDPQSPYSPQTLNPKMQTLKPKPYNPKTLNPKTLKP